VGGLVAAGAGALPRWGALSDQAGAWLSAAAQTPPATHRAPLPERVGPAPVTAPR
jgi:hypothetical protein